MPIKPLNTLLFSVPRILEGDNTLQGQTLHLNETLQVKERLELRNCTILAEGGKIFVSGELIMEDCEVVTTGGTVLRIDPDGAATIKNTNFLVSSTSHGMISAPYTQNLWMEDCSFVQGTIPETPRLHDSRTIIDAGQGRIIGCVFRNIDLEIRAKEFVGSYFEHCGRIQCGFSGENNLINRCTFTDCHDVSVEDGAVKNSKFARVGALYLTRAAAEHCTFREVRCDDASFICLEDGTVTHCGFEDVILENDACLCDSVGFSSLSHCRITNCIPDISKDGLLPEQNTTEDLSV